MNKYSWVFALIVALSQCAFGATKLTVLKVEKLKVGSSEFVVRFFGPAEFCDYDSFTIQKNGKMFLSLKHRCGREVKENGPSVVADGNLVKAVKLGPRPSDIYLLFFEEPSNYVFCTTLITTGDKPSVAFSGNISGRFQDYNNDGLFDLMKMGGHGEPTGALSSYDPYLVYLQTKNGEKIDFKLDERLSKKFSIENNFEWQGSKYDESIQVDEHGKRGR